MEVLDIDVLVWGCLPLAPEQQAFLGSHLLHRDVLDGEPEDDGPDHPQGHLDVAVHDLLGADGDELDALAGDEVERLVDVGDLVANSIGCYFLTVLTVFMPVNDSP